MNVRRVFQGCLVACLLALVTGLGLDQVWGAQPQEPGEVEQGVQVLTRGPVHEAFAGTVTFNPEPGIMVPNSPPEMLEELPPEQRPEGDNVAWIPGYWAWDDERSDFLWVSGIWRNLPPSRQWVPGYWGESGREYQWTSGYWADATASEVEYLPAPPASVEVGPNIAATSANQTWLPGCWIWRQTAYAWRPGYWAAGQPDWVWVPASYAWTPRGYVFVDGYYDYAVANRGVLFAPVYFGSNAYSRRGYSYSPVTVINPAVFASQLFLRPSYQHYYFGDYYAASYSTAGFYPWFSYNSRHYGYDPIYAHERWQHHRDRDWEQQVQADFQHRRDHEEARPPRTWAAQTALVASQLNSTDKTFVVAASLAQLVNSKTSPLRFQPVAQEERQRLVKYGREMQEFRQERQQLEAKAAVTSAADPSQQPEPARVKFSRSPIVAKPADQLSQDQALPKRHEVLKPNLQIEQPTPIQSPPQPKVGRPAPPMPQPRPDVPQPEPPQPQPKPDVPQPEPPQPQPRPDVPQPEPPQPQPKPDVPQPEPPQPQPKPDVPQPEPPQPQPKPDVPQPEPPQPQPRPDVPQPEPPQPQPRPDVPQPEPPQPQPRPDVPQPEPPQPQPKPDVPQPEPPQPRPKPEVGRPAPPRPRPNSEVGRPAPQTAASTKDRTASPTTAASTQGPTTSAATAASTQGSTTSAATAASTQGSTTSAATAASTQGSTTSAATAASPRDQTTSAATAASTQGRTVRDKE